MFVYFKVQMIDGITPVNSPSNELCHTCNGCKLILWGNSDVTVAYSESVFYREDLTTLVLIVTGESCSEGKSHSEISQLRFCRICSPNPLTTANANKNLGMRGKRKQNNTFD